MDFLSRAAKDGASDLFFVPGAPVSYKLDGHLLPMAEQMLTPQESHRLISEIFLML